MSRDDGLLIRFDRKTCAFLGAIVLLCVLGTTFKLHGSSVAMWNGLVAERGEDDGILLGAPRFARIDEWGFFTPALVSQAKSHPSFPWVNPSWGQAQMPLITSLPVRHASILFRPQLWGFFVLDLERAFALHWNMKALLLVGGLFLLLMLLTANDFVVALIGTGWVYFTGFMQWWYSSPAGLPETVGCVALLLVAVHYLALSSRRWIMAASAVILAACLINAALSLYPPFLVPLFYLGIAILAGSLVPRVAASPWRRDLVFRAGCAAAALAVVAASWAVFYRDARPAFELMRGTVYPGSRVAPGGELTVARTFGGFFGFFMSEGHFPQPWLNVCESSNFVLLFPVPLAAAIWGIRRGRRATPLEWSLAAYIVVVLAWLLASWPPWLASATGFGLAAGTRPLLGLGLASTLLACVFLAAPRVDLPEGRGRRIAVLVACVAAIAALAFEFNWATDGFARRWQIAAVILVAGTACYALIARRRAVFAACVLVPNVLGHGLVNPLTSGLGPILDTRLFQEVSKIVESDPNARWTVYGNDNFADFIKATGARVFNGTKFTPPLDDLRVIDTKSAATSIYNRFGHVSLNLEKGPEITFKLFSYDAYGIRLDPAGDAWRRLGIRYVVLPFAASDRAFLEKTDLLLEFPKTRLWVYRYR